MQTANTVIYGLVFSSTPSHGYLEVPAFLVERVCFKPSKFSVHIVGHWYLEEDCDAPELLNRLDSEGIKYRISEYTRGDDYTEMLDRWR
jgi:hypothetical protein